MFYFQNSCNLPLFWIFHEENRVVNKFRKLGISESFSIYVTFLLFLCALILLLIFVLPLLGKQMSLLVAELPNAASRVRDILSDLPEQYDEYITTKAI